MIAKAVKGRSFRGALEYDLSKEQGRVIDTNMCGKTPRALASEFGEMRKLRPKLGKAVLHVSISAALGEHLSDEQWKQVARRYLDGMGLEKNQYLVTRHMDTEHEHIHLLANRIRFDGEVTSDSYDYRRHEVIMRAIERDFGLQQLAPSKAAIRHAPTKGEIEEGLRTGVPSTRQRLQELCDAAASDCGSFSLYAERLHAAGVELLPVIQLAGRRMSGLSYLLDGVMMKGSDLGRGYSASGIVKRGVSYDKERDGKAASECIERFKVERPQSADRGITSSEDQQRGATSADHRAASTGDGSIDGRYQGLSGQDQPVQPDAERAIREASRGDDTGLAQRGSSSGTGSAADGAGRATDGNHPLSDGDGRRGDEWTAGERIVALAGTSTGHTEHVGSEGNRPVVKAGDRSAIAAQRQMTAMGCQRFVVTLIDAKLGKQEERDWDQQKVMQNIGWLKHMNARGYDVWIRPSGEHNLIVLSGLSAAQLQALKDREYLPAVVIETGTGQYQAWLKLSHLPVAQEMRSLVAQEFLKDFKCSGKNITERLDGRMAGFTNQQVLHSGGRHPFVALTAYNGNISPYAEMQIERLKSAKTSKLNPIKSGNNRSRGVGR